MGQSMTILLTALHFTQRTLSLAYVASSSSSALASLRSAVSKPSVNEP
jgi:hypothetical protein